MFYSPTVTLTWQSGRQLATYGSGSKLVTYGYDGDGLRVSKTGARNTEYIIVGGTYVGERTTINGTEYLIAYLYGDSGIVGINVNGTNYYFVKNLQGDITGIIDTEGNVAARYTYDVYGTPIDITDGDGNAISPNNHTHIANLNPFRYRGYTYDQETGFYYLTTRYYDPYVGRFLNADGLVSTGQGFDGYNMFAYCESNPVSYVDPTGEYKIYYEELMTHAKKFNAGVVDAVPGVVIRDMKDSLLIRQAYAGKIDPSILFEEGIISYGCKFVGPPVMPVEGGQFKDDDYFSYIGYPDSEHFARDIEGTLGSNVLAAFGGTVVSSETHWSYGTNIVIETTINGSKYRVIYAHLTENSIKWDVGDYVNAGDIVGTVGMTGNTDGPHVHVEMRNNKFVHKNDNVDIKLFF